MDMISARFAGLIAVGCGLWTPNADATVYSVEPAQLEVTREGFSGSVESNRHNFLVLSHVWELTPTDSLYFWITAKPSPGRRILLSGDLHIGSMNHQIDGFAYREETGEVLFTVPEKQNDR